MSIDLRTRQGWEDLKRIIDDRPDDVLSLCGIALPNRRTASCTIDDPRGHGRGNFAIWLKSDGLSWKNFTTDEKGRSLELIAYCFGWYDQDKRGAEPAARLAIERLGLGRIDRAQLDADRQAAAARRIEADTARQEQAAKRAGAAFRMFTGAGPLLNSQAERYLRGRGIDLTQAPFLGPRNGAKIPGALRCAPSQKHIDDDGKVTFWPAMIAACVDVNMRVRAVHRTFLRPTGSDKTPVTPARKVWPESAGLVIPLWRGSENNSLREAEETRVKHGLCETLVLTEGVEDGLSAVIAAPEHRVWAMISLSNMVNVAARLPACCDSIIVHRQNDWDKPAAVAAFERGLAALRASGRYVAIVEAPIGKDLNDTLRARAEAPEQAEHASAAKRTSEAVANGAEERGAA